MTTIQEVADYLERFAPVALAEDWDNVGLLVGDFARPVSRILTCLTVTQDVVDEACRDAADLIISHHPLPFRALKRITSETSAGALLLQLIRGGVAVFSPHTAFDSAAEGINQQLAAGLELSGVRPLRLHPDLSDLGVGRCGELLEPLSLASLVQRVKAFLSIESLHVVGDDERMLQRVAVACGSAGEMLADAVRQGCDALLLGETNLHTCLEAQARDVSLILVGHYASERFAVERLAERLAREFPAADVWPSRAESDPLRWIH